MIPGSREKWHHAQPPFKDWERKMINAQLLVERWVKTCNYFHITVKNCMPIIWVFDSAAQTKELQLLRDAGHKGLRIGLEGLLIICNFLCITITLLYNVPFWGQRTLICKSQLIYFRLRTHYWLFNVETLREWMLHKQLFWRYWVFQLDVLIFKLWVGKERWSHNLSKGIWS